jgi:hypothetical protein
MVLAGLGVAVALVIDVVSVFIERPIPGLLIALVLAVLVGTFGQLWTIFALQRRGRMGGSPRRWGAPTSFGDATRWLFWPLPRRTVVVLSVLIVGGWISVITSILLSAGGQPSRNHDPTCPYTTDNHGSISCVSKATYLRSYAAEQRLVAGAVLFFFTVHFGVARSEVMRHRQAGPSAT